MNNILTGAAAARMLSAACFLFIAVSCWGGGVVSTPPSSLPPSPTATPSATPVVVAPTAPSPVAPGVIQSIRNRYTEVRGRLRSFRRVKREMNDFSTEGGELQAFFEGKTLRLGKATFYGEMGRSDEEYYYDDDGRPFFIFEREARYNKPFGKTKSIREHRYYFHEGRLVRWLDGRRQVPLNDAAFAARENELLEFSGRVRAAAGRP